MSPHAIIEPAHEWLPFGVYDTLEPECPTESRLLKDDDKHLGWCVRVN